MNLSTLSGPELRRLLDAARERGQAQLSYQILQEMAARREARGQRGLFRMRRPDEPRILDVDLSDAAPPEDDIPPMPAWRPPAREPVAAASRPAESGPRRSRLRKPAATAPVAEPEPEPPAAPPPEPPRPRSVWDDEPEPPRLDVEKLGLRTPRRKAGVSLGPVGGFAVGTVAGIVGGIVVGVWMGGREAPPPAPPPAAALRTAAIAPPPAPAPVTPVVAPQPAPEPPPPVAAEPPAPAVVETEPAPSPDAEDLAQETTGPALELPRAPEPEEASDACAAQPTPADRTICGDPELRRLQRQLRRAYTTALAAHEERGLLRERQLAWADARDGITDRDRLERLYEERIRKLNAATAAARRER